MTTQHDSDVAARIRALSPDKRRALERALAARAAQQAPAEAGPSTRPSAPQAGPGLSSAQRRMWFLDQRDQGRAAYNVPTALRLFGTLDVAALRRALTWVVERHEILRTTFREIDGAVVPQIGDAAPVLHEVDVADRPPAAALEAVETMAADAGSTPLALDREVLRATLYRLTPTEHVLHLVMHHMVIDGWSVALLQSELEQAYRAFAVGAAPDLPPLPARYADYVAAETELLNGPRGQAALDYWRGALADAPDGVNLPTTAPPDTTADAVGTLPFGIDEPHYSALKAFCRAQRVSLFVGFLTLLQATLARYTQSDDVVVGTEVSVRDRAEFAELVGLFVNQLPLRCDLSGGPGLAEACQRVARVVREAFAHQSVPFDRMVRTLDRQGERQPLFNVVLSLRTLASDGASSSDGSAPVPRFEPLPDGGPKRFAPKFDLVFSLVDDGRRLGGAIEFDRRLFAEAAVGALAAALQRLAEVGLADPQCKLSRVALLTSEPADWNDTSLPLPATVGLHRLFEASADRTPDHPAILHGTEVLSHGDVERRANRLAWRLIEAGVGPEQVVACCLSRGPGLVIAMLAVLKAGGAVLVIDPLYASDRGQRILEDARPSAILADAAGSAVLPDGAANVLSTDVEPERVPDSRPARAIEPEQLAYVIYTSGSTGTPKGVMGHHRGLAALSEAQVQAFALRPDDRVLQASAVTFDAFIWELTLVWRAGATLVMMPGAMPLPDQEMLASMQRARVSMLTIPPSVLDMLPAGELPDLRLLVVAGEACPVALTERFASGRRMVNAYGPTETTVWASGERCVTGQAPPIGRPVANMRLHVVDGDLQPLPAGAVGEIALGGPAVTRGYLGQPALTAERFRPDPFAPTPGPRLYLTGDLGCRLPDGRVRYLGRCDDQVKIRGFRVEPGEAQAVLCRHPAVAQAAVLTVERDGRTHLVAWWTPRAEAAEIGDAELRAFARQQLPTYLRPSAYVRLAELPLTPHGKLDRHALPAPDWTAPRDAEAGGAPKPGVEAGLAEIWSQVLGVARIGRHDNFFELGGDSILSVQVVSRARRAGMDLTAMQLFAYPSLAGLAAVVGRLDAATTRPPALVGTDLPLSSLQEGLLFHCLRSPDLPLYVQRFRVTIEGPLDVDALERAWTALLSRHEALRTAVLWRGRDAPVQRVAPAAPLRIRRDDWRDLRPAEQDKRRAAWLDAEATTGFDLEHAPLLRCRVVQTANERYEVSWACHHMLVDGWSFAVIERDLFALYAAERDGRPPPAPPAAQFRDYLAWLAQQDTQAAHAWWAEHLKGFDTPLRLGEARSEVDPSAEDEIWGDVSELLDAAADRRLRAFAAREGLTLNTVIQAAWALVLSRQLRRRDLIYGLIASGRPADLPGVEEIVGLFINTLPCRLRVQADSSVRAFLQSVQDTVAEMQRFGFLSLAELQRFTDVPPGEAPFDALLVVQNLPGGGNDPDDLRLTAAPVSARTDYALTVIVEAAGRTALRFVHDRRVLGASRTRALATALRAALEALPHAAAGPVGAWSANPDASLPPPTPRQGAESAARLTTLVAARAAERPDVTALVFEDRHLSYAALEARSNRLAQWLMAQGVGPEVPVALYLDRSFALVEAMLAIMKAGGAFMPLSLEAPAARLGDMLAETAPPLVLTQKSLAARLPAGNARLVLLDEDALPWASAATTPPDVTIHPDNVVHIFYTSGSTGRPKGVVSTYGGLCNRVLWGQRAHPLTRDDRVMQKTPYGFDVSVWEWLWPLTVGARLVIARPDGHKDPDYLAALAEREAVTLMHFVPSMLRIFLDDPARLARCTSLRRVMCSGEAVSGELRDRFQASSDAELLNLYGPTEASIEVSHWRCGADEREPAVPMGRLIDNVVLRVVDPDGHACPIGVPGELLIGGVAVARGYRAQPGLTAARFCPDPLAERPGDRVYRTGDLAAWRHDGSLDYLGRIDWQVKIRGQRVELGEIEAVLQSCDGVREAVVDYRQDAEGDGRLIAYLVGTADIDSVTEALARRLPPVMRPAHLVRLDALPLTTSGKLDRGRLPDPAAAGPERGGRGGAATDALERAVAAIFAEVLGRGDVGHAGIGRHDHFAFDLGGHSLQVLRALGRLDRGWPGRLALADFLRDPSVAAVASLLRDDAGTTPQRLAVPLRAEGTAPPLFVVHPALGAVICYLELARQFPVGRPLYALQAPELAGGPSSGDLTELANRYVAAARQIQPSGPLSIAGYSFGGLLAFEMARQAAATGDPPALLAILDTLAPPAEPSGDSGPDETALLAELAGVLERYDGRTPSLSAADLQPLAPAAQVARVERHLAEGGVLDGMAGALDLPAMLAASRSAGRARAGYRPGPYDGSLVLVRCETPSAEDRQGAEPALLADPALGWSRWVRGEIRTIRVPGDHVELLRGGNAGTVARWLAERLGGG